MTFWEIVNPWGALRRERRLFVTTVADYEAERALGRDALRAAQQRADDLETKINISQNDLLLCKLRNHTLQRTIAQGHFRNPETGRIGPKGVTYS